MMPSSVPTGPRLVPVMRTMDRSPRPNYLSQTMAHLRSLHFPPSGWDILPLQLVDTGVATETWPHRLREAEELGAVLHLAPQKLNNNQNGLRALEIGLSTGADWILHLEDDLLPCKEVGRSITDWLDDHMEAAQRVPFVAFFAAYAQVAQAWQRDVNHWKYPANAFYGNQAWAMSREMAQSAVDFLRERIPLWRPTQGFDMLLQRWMEEKLGAKYLLASAPCFFQHAGLESGLNNRFFQTSSWAGPNWTYTRRSPQ